MSPTIRLIAVLLASVLLAACATRKPAPEPAAPVTDRPAPAVTPQPSDGRYTPEDLDRDSCLRQRQVYFDFDKSNIRPEFESIIACHAKYLRDRPSARITLEGHADERGTREYNLGLGERRANSVASALRAQGGGAEQLSTVSYGEERPVCTESNEDCWWRNRRVEIIYTAR
ncbi:MAG: peptidoglycan-associated lipoprotein Pal [Xanthomonadales bacterium]|nr:peptidoglycan-associated lipoprotein Pal [Xanthomonadales bacterium]